MSNIKNPILKSVYGFEYVEDKNHPDIEDILNEYFSFDKIQFNNSRNAFDIFFRKLKPEEEKEDLKCTLIFSYFNLILNKTSPPFYLLDLFYIKLIVRNELFP